jgi:hypothetical protein
MVGEKLICRPENADGNDWGDNESWCGPGWPDTDIMRGAHPNGSFWHTPSKDLNVATAPDHQLAYRFGSAHPNGTQFVFGDGGVRLVKFNVDATNFMRMCKRDDAQTVNFD